jgi:MFS family permease
MFEDMNEDRNLRDLITITISVIVGSIISLYINQKYGTDILYELKTDVAFNIIIVSLGYLFFFAIIIIFLFLAIRILTFILNIYINPIFLIYNEIKKKNRIMIKIEKFLFLDLKILYKNPLFNFLIVTTIFILLIVYKNVLTSKFHIIIYLILCIISIINVFYYGHLMLFKKTKNKKVDF